MAKWWLALGLLALVVVGCGPRMRSATGAVAATTSAATSRYFVEPTTSPPAVTRATSTPLATPAVLPADRLYLAAGFVNPSAAAGRSGWVMMNTADPAHAQDMPVGVPAPDWSTTYTVRHAGSSTTVQAVDLQSGQVVHTVTFAGTYDLPDGGAWPQPGGLSPNGQWLAVQHNPTGSEQTAYARAGQWQSHFVVLPTTFTQPPVRIDLHGSFSLDALSNEGSSLYLIEAVPSATVPDQYRVRRYNLAQSTLQPGAIADKTGTDVMSGTRRAAVPSRYGHWLFSLYLNTRSGPFIHALNLTDGYAVCIDLPVTGTEKTAPSALWSLALAPDGTTLYAANGELGVVSAINTGNLDVARTVHFPVATEPNPLQALARWLAPSAEAKGTEAGAALSPDGKTLYVLGAHGLFILDATDLAVRTQQFADWPLAGLAVSPEGRYVYLLRADGPSVYVVDAQTSHVAGTLGTSVIPFGILHVASAGSR